MFTDTRNGCHRDSSRRLFCLVFMYTVLVGLLCNTGQCLACFSHVDGIVLTVIIGSLAVLGMEISKAGAKLLQKWTDCCWHDFVSRLYEQFRHTVSPWGVYLSLFVVLALLVLSFSLSVSFSLSLIVALAGWTLACWCPVFLARQDSVCLCMGRTWLQRGRRMMEVTKKFSAGWPYLSSLSKGEHSHGHTSIHTYPLSFHTYQTALSLSLSLSLSTYTHILFSF